jgi:hypothetical protein
MRPTLSLTTAGWLTNQGKRILPSTMGDQLGMDVASTADALVPTCSIVTPPRYSLRTLHSPGDAGAPVCRTSQANNGPNPINRNMHPVVHYKLAPSKPHRWITRQLITGCCVECGTYICNCPSNWQTDNVCHHIPNSLLPDWSLQLSPHFNVRLTTIQQWDRNKLRRKMHRYHSATRWLLPRLTGVIRDTVIVPGQPRRWINQLDQPRRAIHRNGIDFYHSAVYIPQCSLCMEHCGQ